MEQHRPILAILLILAIFLGFSYWNTRKAAERAAEQAVVEVATEEAATGTAVEQPQGDELQEAVRDTRRELLGADAAEVGETVGSVASEEEVITTVETSAWTARLSNRGATLVSWELKEYTDASGELVQLVPDGQSALGAAIEYGTRTIDTSSIVFEGPGDVALTPDNDGGFILVGFKAETADGLRLTRQYTFYADSYAFELYVSTAGLDEPAAQRQMVLGWPGVPPTEEREDERADRASVVMLDGKAGRHSLSSVKDEARSVSGDVAWATSQAKYFMAAVIPIEQQFSRVVAYRDTSGEMVRFDASVGMEQGNTANEFLIYAGPQDYQAVSALEVELEQAVYLGWPWLRPLSAVMLRALMWAHGLIPNYGVVIILFSVLTKLIFYRLTHKSFTEMKRMQELQPKIKALQEKYKDDKQAQGTAQMRLYKEEGVSPFGSCLPMLLQMPVFIALYQVLRTTIELRGASFALWITDLSQPDTIATIAGFSIHVLPLLMGVGMLIQQRFSSTDPSQAAMGRLMPIVFTVIFYNIASGLVLYWLVNTVLSIAQQYYIHRGPSSLGEKSRVAAAPQGVPDAGDAPPGPDTSEFADAEVVEDEPKRPGGSGKRSGKRRKKRKK